MERGYTTEVVLLQNIKSTNFQNSEYSLLISEVCIVFCKSIKKNVLLDGGYRGQRG